MKTKKRVADSWRARKNTVEGYLVIFQNRKWEMSIIPLKIKKVKFLGPNGPNGLKFWSFFGLKFVIWSIFWSIFWNFREKSALKLKKDKVNFLVRMVQMVRNFGPFLAFLYFADGPRTKWTRRPPPKTPCRRYFIEKKYGKADSIYTLAQILQYYVILRNISQ